MRVFVEVDANGRVTVPYGEGVSPVIPIGAIALSEADGLLIREATCKGDYKLVNGALVLDTVFVSARELSDAQYRQKAEIEFFRDQARCAAVTVNGHVYQADMKSQALLAQAISLAQAGLPLPPVWRDAENVDVPIAKIADLVAIAGAIAQQTQDVYAKSWALKAKIDASTTVADVEGVIW